MCVRMCLCISPTYGAVATASMSFLCVGLLHQIANAVRAPIAAYAAVPFSFSMHACQIKRTPAMYCFIENCLSIPSNRTEQQHLYILLWQCQSFSNERIVAVAASAIFPQLSFHNFSQIFLLCKS